MSRYLSIIWLLLWWSPVVWGQQDTLRLNKALQKHEMVQLGGFYTLFEDSLSPKLSFEKIQERTFSPHDTAAFRAVSPVSVTWIHFVIQNNSLTDTINAIYTSGNHLSLVLYSVNKKGQLTQSNNGYVKGKITFQHNLQNRFGIPISILPMSIKSFWVRQECLFYYTSFKPTIYSLNRFKQYNHSSFFSKRYPLIFLWFLIGICFFLFFFYLIQFAYTKNPMYGWWSLYLACNTIFFLFASDIALNFPIIPISAYDIYIHIEYMILMSYLFFFTSFLQLKKYSSNLHKAIVVVIIIMAVVSIVGLYLICFHTKSGYTFYDYIFYVMQALIYGIFVATLLGKIPNKKMILIGSFSLSIFSIYAVVISQLGYNNSEVILRNPTLIYGFGVIIELFFVSMALSQKIKKVEVEKEILEIERKREKDYLTKVKVEYQQQIAQTEIVALRSQMNPHFIFNCLNSIQLFTAQNNTEKASDYLAKFSRLIRLVLENSRSEKVTLENELETLRLYIEMEAMRFRDKVTFQINKASNIDESYIQIPPLLLQPFVENAIWHGLMHKEEGGTVQIDVTQPKENLLLIEITDDGIGREKAAEFKSKSATQNKSFGMKVTAERIELINQLYNTATQVHIIDLKNKQDEPMGTKVVVEIPIQL